MLNVCVISLGVEFSDLLSFGFRIGKIVKLSVLGGLFLFLLLSLYSVKHLHASWALFSSASASSPPPKDPTQGLNLFARTTNSSMLTPLLSLRKLRALCLHFSLIRTAKQHKLDPYQYYVEIMKAIPHCETAEDYEALLPWNIDLVKMTSIINNLQSLIIRHWRAHLYCSPLMQTTC